MRGFINAVGSAARKLGQSVRSTAGKVTAGAGAFLVAGAASATTPAVDVSAAVTAFGDVATANNSIGVAMVGAAIGGVIYKWVTAYIL